MQIGRFSIEDVTCILQGITVPLGTLSLGAKRFMSIKKTSHGVLCSTQIFALLILAGHY